MKHPIEINYMNDPGTKDQVYRISVTIAIPQDKVPSTRFEMKQLLVSAYAKADVLEQLKERLND